MRRAMLASATVALSAVLGGCVTSTTPSTPASTAAPIPHQTTATTPQTPAGTATNHPTGSETPLMLTTPPLSLFSPWQSLPPRKPRVAFIGDSYTVGLRGDGVRWTSVVADANGWEELNFGLSGTGFVADGGRSCGEQLCQPYRHRINKVVASHPDIVIVSGGRNDRAAYSPIAIRLFFQELRAQLPQASIYALNPLYGAEIPTPGWILRMGEDVRIAVHAVDGTYVDIGQLFRGRTDLMDPDGVHPNPAGYRYLGEKLAHRFNG